MEPLYRLGLTLSGSVQNWWWHDSSMPHTQLRSQIRWALAPGPLIRLWWSSASPSYASTVPLMRCLGSILGGVFFFLKCLVSMVSWQEQLKRQRAYFSSQFIKVGRAMKQDLELSSYVWSHKRVMNAHSVPSSVLCSPNAFLGGIVSSTTEMGLPKPINIINLIILPQACPETSPRWF